MPRSHIPVANLDDTAYIVDTKKRVCDRTATTKQPLKCPPRARAFGQQTMPAPHKTEHPPLPFFRCCFGPPADRRLLVCCAVLCGAVPCRTVPYRAVRRGTLEQEFVETDAEKAAGVFGGGRGKAAATAAADKKSRSKGKGKGKGKGGGADEASEGLVLGVSLAPP